MTHQYMEIKIRDLEKRIRTLEQEPCEDAISREAVKDAICDYVCAPGIRCKKSHNCRMKSMLDKIPSVYPKQNLDKIRAEIMDFEEELFHRPNTDYTDYAAVRHCVEIIDKYKAESEG